MTEYNLGGHFYKNIVVYIKLEQYNIKESYKNTQQILQNYELLT